eukprot:TRINITY_DN46945_c0_g1_i1.p1 TRINITY_DN46945_c0_g1~~TRINITY_DN46945_c0_g1_i1.p1  ORF type:complete len:292 (-),score=40.44 TRINITY_DN46945_c0_g1_i1:65-940(-)
MLRAGALCMVEVAVSLAFLFEVLASRPRCLPLSAVESSDVSKLSVAFLTGHIGRVVPYIPPKPPTSHAYFIIDEVGVPGWLPGVLEHQGWHVLRLHGSSDHDAVNMTMRSKLAKIPQDRWDVLRDYDFIVWFDDKFRVDVTAAHQILLRWPPCAAMSLHRHPKRCIRSFPNCSVWDEVHASVTQQRRYKRQAARLEAYVYAQQRLGFATEARALYQAGFIIYNQRHPETSRLQSVWMRHIGEAGINDQVSLYFVAQLFNQHIMEFTPEWGQQLWNGKQLTVEPGVHVALLH